MGEDRIDNFMRKIEDGNGSESDVDPIESLESILDILDEMEEKLDDYRLGLCHAARMLLYELYRTVRDEREGL